MKRRQLLFPMLVTLLLAVAGVITAVATSTTPVLGLDLQGGFSVVLQAREVDGRLPSEESVEKAKDIIRQRVDGLGVAEPDITRQGHTVIVQLPGVSDREKAEEVVGCTARLEFRPVLEVLPNPAAPMPEGMDDLEVPGEGELPATSVTDGSTTTEAPAEGDEPSDTGGDGEEGLGEFGSGMAGLAPGEGALPVQFAPTTTSTTVPTTTTEATTTTETPATTTTTPAPGDEATGVEPVSGGCGDTGVIALPDDLAPLDPSLPEGTARFVSEDGLFIYTLGPVGFTGDALSSATATLANGQWMVNVEIKGEDQQQANDAFNECYSGGPGCPSTSASSGASLARGSIAIVLDGQVISAPVVNGPDLASNPDGFTISGGGEAGFEEGEAKDLALVLRYGSLPVEFEQAALQQVSATLGEDSLRAGLIAGLIGVALLAAYMVFYYRGFGLVVVASLLVWSGLMYGLVCLLGETQGLALTLAGITGIIVSIGTTVDTYVVVFERIKDELREGKSLRRATETGYKNGIRTVITANGAAFIGAFLLWYLTIGPVRGFAYFLGISVILDLAVAIMFTRPLLMLLARSKRFGNSRFFGITVDVEKDAGAAAPTPAGGAS